MSSFDVDVRGFKADYSYDLRFSTTIHDICENNARFHIHFTLEGVSTFLSYIFPNVLKPVGICGGMNFIFRLTVSRKSQTVRHFHVFFVFF